MGKGGSTDSHWLRMRYITNQGNKISFKKIKEKMNETILSKTYIVSFFSLLLIVPHLVRNHHLSLR